MSRRVYELLDDAVAGVSERPGDLEAVRERARQRSARRRAGLTGALALVVIVAAVAVLPWLAEPSPPVIGPPDEDQTVMHLRFCPPSSCPDAQPDLDELRGVFEAEPAVHEVRVWTFDEVAGTLADIDLTVDDDGVPVVVDVIVDAGPPARQVAQRLREMTGLPLSEIAGVSIARGGFADWIARAHQRPPAYDPDAVVSPRREIVTFELDDERRYTLEGWQVADGGVCLALDEQLWCGPDVLRDHGFGARVLVTPDREVSCLFGDVALDAEEVIIEFADHGERAAVLADAPDTMLARAYLVCVDDDILPVAGEARDPRGSASWTSDPDRWHGERPRPTRVEPEGPVPASERQHLGDIPVTGSDEHLPLWLFLDERGDVCLELRGMGCTSPPSEREPLPALLTSAWSTGGEDPRGCVSGTVHTSVDTVEVTYSDGTAEQLTPLRGDGELGEIAAFASCWVGDHETHDSTALDAEGNIIGEQTRPPRP